LEIYISKRRENVKQSGNVRKNKEMMRKKWQILREQQDYEIHANTSNSSCLSSHITCSILYALGNMIENKKKNGE